MYILNCATRSADSSGKASADAGPLSHERSSSDDVRRFALATPTRLQESLAASTQAFARRAACLEGCIVVDTLGTLAWRMCGACVETGWRPAGTPARKPAERRALPRDPLAQPWISLALVYASCRMGELRLPASQVRPLEAAAAFARRCAHLVKRHELLRWSSEWLGRPLMLTGTSRPLQRLEAFIETSADSDLPILIRGEPGTEKALVAAAIHLGGRGAEMPFVEVACTQPGATPECWLREARGGTLFLNGIDELPSSLQVELGLRLRARSGHGLELPAGESVRLIASTTADLGAQAMAGGFSSTLLAELDVLSTTVPPLRERLEDLEALVAAVLLRAGRSVEEARIRELAQRCRRYAWPENLAELERVIARLPLLEDDRIALADVPLPRIGGLDDRVAVPSERGEDAIVAAPDDTAPRALAAVADSTALRRWIDDALALEPERLQRLHPALRKALLHLGRHFAEPMSLGDLAASAHVSPSHLGFLFRSVVGHPFKHLLQAVRLERAKSMLRDDPHQRITDVALNVGFRDLSHFEKCFRRTVGQTPREFRARDSSSCAKRPSL